MNKKLIIIVIIVVAIIAAIGYVFIAKKDTATAPTSQSTPSTDSNSGAQTSPSTDATAGVYTTYSADKLSQASGKRVLFFHAPWCPQCQALDKSISSSSIPSGVTIFKTDYDSNQALRQKYGVTLQTTLVLLDDSGNVVEKYVAYETPTFEAVKQNLSL